MRRWLAPLTVAVVGAVAAAGCYDHASPTSAGGGVQLQAPATLTSISLNGAVDLQWSDNAYSADPNDFNYYQVYSTSYNLDQNLCGASWATEGTTVSPEFLVGALTNGVPECFKVTAVSLDNIESAESPLRNDTPRPDARNIVLWAVGDSAGRSGFRFWLDANNDGIAQPTELGITGAGGSTLMDFYVDSTAAGLTIVPQRPGDSLQAYTNGPIADLTSIDIAPNGGYARSPLLAQPMWGYVVQMIEGQYYVYGGLRITAVGPNYIIFDWSYQTDPGNPELIRMAAKK